MTINDEQSTDPVRLLQARAEAMTQGDFSALGAPIGGSAALEDLRRAMDVLGEHVAQAQHGMHAYIGTLTSAQEAERIRIARELHDDIVQRLIAVGQSIDRVQRTLDGDVARGQEQLRVVRADVTEAVQSLRAVIANLRPPALDELGLIPAIEFLLRRTDPSQPELTLAIEGERMRLDPQSELAAFRIVQEAWSNVLRHAQAQHVAISLQFTHNALLITIADDGRGFVPAEHGAIVQGEWGLTDMAERAALVGGAVTIESRPNHGTTIVVRMPYLGRQGRDPICGMEVGPNARSVEYKGRLYRFCSQACEDLFRAQPEDYVRVLG